MPDPMRIVVLGLSITSSWGNGHATTFRGLIRELAARGHDVLFLERDVPWYASQRDLPEPGFCRLGLYSSIDDLKNTWRQEVREADFVLVGSYVPEGVEVGKWVLETARGGTGFYDIDTPVTLAKLRRGDFEYLTPELIALYDVYFSFSGGPTLGLLERDYGSPAARALYCSFDPETYFPESMEPEWDLGYMGTYSDDRQPPLQKLMLDAAASEPGLRFVVAGPQYPESIVWPENVARIEHLPPSEHRAFYNRQRFTLNITRADMIAAGYSPSVRLFEAAACGVPIISDYWDGLDSFFKIGREIFVSHGPEETLACLREVAPHERRQVGESARARVMAEHTAAHRAESFERDVRAVLETKGRSVAAR